MRHLLLFPKAEPGFEVTAVIGIPIEPITLLSCQTDKLIPTLEYKNLTGEESKKDLTGLSMEFSYSIQ